MIAALALVAQIAAGQATPPAGEGEPAPASAPGASPAAVGSGSMDTLTHAPVLRPFEMPALAPVAPLPYARVAPDPKAPVPVERYRGDYEPGKDELQVYYEQGVRGRFQAEQSLLGALDGVWTVSGADGQALYVLVLNDPGLSGGLEAAWRRLQRPSGPAARGVADEVRRDQTGLTLSFEQPDPDTRVSLRLTQGADGRWRGDLVENGRRQPVVMARAPEPS